MRQGVKVWNEWRELNPRIKANLKDEDLSEANLREVDLSKVNLIGAKLCKSNLKGAYLRATDLTNADLSGADLSEADLSYANLSRAILIRTNLKEAYLISTSFRNACLVEADIGEALLDYADFSGADLRSTDFSGSVLRWSLLSGANLSGAKLCEAYLFEADISWSNLDKANFSDADLTGSDLKFAFMVKANFSKTILTGCEIYGISAWDLDLEGANQSELIITPEGEPIISVDNLEIGQFIYLLLNNDKIRHIIDNITSKVVLILGRFTDERKLVLNAIRNELRRRDYLPILFDFDRPASRDLTETISTLAHMSRFIIADITEPRSIPQELQSIVPNLPSVPVQPLLLSKASEYGMFEHFNKYPWVLQCYRYESQETLIAAIPEKVIAPAELKAEELRKGIVF